jgi:hypothetical protein
MPSVSPITGGELGKIRSFLIDHEKLLIVVLGAILIFAGYVKVSNIIAAHDAANLKQAQIVAAQQADANAVLAKQNAALAAQAQQDAAALKVLNDKVVAQNQQLTNANVALANALTKQQKTDASLPPTDLALRWQQIVPTLPPDSVKVATTGEMDVTQAGAVATVQQLEKVPVLQQQLDNETAQKNNDDSLIAQQNKSLFDFGGQVTGLNNQIVGLNKQIVDNSAVCQDQIKVVKDQAAKSKRRWFIIGFISGFVSRQLLIGKGL